MSCGIVESDQANFVILWGTVLRKLDGVGGFIVWIGSNEKKKTKSRESVISLSLSRRCG